MAFAEFFVTGFVDNQTQTPVFGAETQSEAEIVFNERVSRGDIQVRLYSWKKEYPFTKIKEVCRDVPDSSLIVKILTEDVKILTEDVKILTERMSNIKSKLK